MTDHLLQAVDRGDVSLLALTDISRAFDVIHHQTLLDQLQLLQIAPVWFRSYLSVHIQCVRLAEGETSELLPINIGIHQGSCMGPMLFNIATISTACYVPTEVDGFAVRVTGYADDTQLAILGPKERLPDIQTALGGILDTLATHLTHYMQNMQNSVHAERDEGQRSEDRADGDRRQNRSADCCRETCSGAFVGETLQPVPTASEEPQCYI